MGTLSKAPGLGWRERRATQGLWGPAWRPGTPIFPYTPWLLAIKMLYINALHVMFGHAAMIRAVMTRLDRSCLKVAQKAQAF